MSWIDNLNTGVKTRLSQCCNTKADLPYLVNARWKFLKDKGKDKEGFTKEDAAVDIMDWLDSNHQWSLCDITKDEWDELVKE